MDRTSAVPPFTIVQLDDETLADAWPVVRLTTAEAVADWWESEARALMDRGGGVLAARSANGSVHGIATYECVHRLRAGSMLAVDRLVTFELNRKQPVKEALCEALYAIAAAYCCSSIALPLPSKGYLQQRTRRIYGADA